MIKPGIVDPLKIVGIALVDVSGVASLLTTSEACVVGAPEKDKPAGGGMGGVMEGIGSMGGFFHNRPEVPLFDADYLNLFLRPPLVMFSFPFAYIHTHTLFYSPIIATYTYTQFSPLSFFFCLLQCCMDLFFRSRKE
jgi:hypothetical protein